MKAPKYTCTCSLTKNSGPTQQPLDMIPLYPLPNIDLFIIERQLKRNNIPLQTNVLRCSFISPIFIFVKYFAIYALDIVIYIYSLGLLQKTGNCYMNQICFHVAPTNCFHRYIPSSKVK